MTTEPLTPPQAIDAAIAKISAEPKLKASLWDKLATTGAAKLVNFDPDKHAAEGGAHEDLEGSHVFEFTLGTGVAVTITFLGVSKAVRWSDL